MFQQLNSAGKLEPVPGRVDECNVYSVLYEVTPDMQFLNGGNVLSPDNPNIVAIAAISEEDRKGSEEWEGSMCLSCFARARALIP